MILIQVKQRILKQEMLSSLLPLQIQTQKTKSLTTLLMQEINYTLLPAQSLEAEDLVFSNAFDEQVTDCNLVKSGLFDNYSTPSSTSQFPN